MKTLFFIISAVGLVYLLVSSLDTEIFSFTPSKTVIEREQDMHNEDAISSDTLADIMQDIKALSQSYAALQKDVWDVSSVNSNIQQAVETIESKLAKVAISSESDTPAEVKREGPKPSVELDKTLEQPQALIVDFATEDSTVRSAQDSEQQKRMRQQAVLRDLAQKRQFAAITALQTSSGR